MFLRCPALLPLTNFLLLCYSHTQFIPYSHFGIAQRPDGSLDLRKRWRGLSIDFVQQMSRKSNFSFNIRQAADSDSKIPLPLTTFLLSSSFRTRMAAGAIEMSRDNRQILDFAPSPFDTIQAVWIGQKHMISARSDPSLLLRVFHRYVWLLAIGAFGLLSVVAHITARARGTPTAIGLLSYSGNSPTAELVASSWRQPLYAYFMHLLHETFNKLTTALGQGGNFRSLFFRTYKRTVRCVLNYQFY